MLGIPDHPPSIGYSPHHLSASAKGAPFLYSGGNPLQGQWSFDPQRSGRLTHPPEPSLISRTPSLLLAIFPYMAPVWPPGLYLLKMDRAYSWKSVHRRAIIFFPPTCRPAGRGSISLFQPVPQLVYQHLCHILLPAFDFRFPLFYNYSHFPPFPSPRVTRLVPDLRVITFPRNPVRVGVTLPHTAAVYDFPYRGTLCKPI